jgi:DnaD/phage-associated family protein
MISLIGQFNAFYRWMETADIGPAALALWMALLKISNDAGWKLTFNASNSMLSVKTAGLSIPAIHRARNQLQQQGRITFRVRKGNQSSEYTIIPFAERYVKQSDQQTDSNATNKPTANRQHSDQQTDSTTTSIATTYIEEKKREEIENEKNKKKSRGHDPEFGEVAKLFQSNVHPFSGPVEKDMIMDLVDTYGANWTQRAIREAIRAGVLNLKYVTKILQNWKATGGPTTKRKPAVDAAQMAAEMREEGIESW